MLSTIMDYHHTLTLAEFLVGGFGGLRVDPYGIQGMKKDENLNPYPRVSWVIIALSLWLDSWWGVAGLRVGAWRCTWVEKRENSSPVLTYHGLSSHPYFSWIIGGGICWTTNWCLMVHMGRETSENWNLFKCHVLSLHPYFGWILGGRACWSMSWCLKVHMGWETWEFISCPHLLLIIITSLLWLDSWWEDLLDYELVPEGAHGIGINENWFFYMYSQI